MTQQQTIVGFFDNAAEAQQAVQLLLAQGFSPGNVSLSTPTSPDPAAADGLTVPVEADNRSGRFFSSLFGDGEAGRVGAAPSRRLGRTTNGPAGEQAARQSGTWVTVQVQSPTEAKQAAELLDTAGAGDVAVERTNAAG